MKRAISQTISLLVIVGLVIAISIGVSGWFLGVWTKFAHVSALEILSAKSALYVNGSFKIVVINKGDNIIKIVRIEVDSWSKTLSSNVITVTESSFTITTNDILAIKPGYEVVLIGNVTNVNFKEDQQVTVRIITDEGVVVIGSLTVVK